VVTYSLLGLPFALIRPVVALFTGIAGGFITNRIDKTDIITEEEEKGKGLPAGFFPRIREMFRYAFVEFLQDISGWLVAGLGIAALISVIVPDNFFAGVAGNDLVEMLIILVAAIPVYICATASVPIAAVLMLKGLSPGAALVLLMAGPATNAATITMITRVMGRRALMAYLFSISLGALFFGLIINRLLPASWFAVDRIMGHAGHEHQILPDWLMYSSAVLLVLLIINGYIQKWLKAGKQEKDYQLKVSDMSNIHKIKVEGMTCNHCKSNVESALSSLEGIRSASADIRSGDVVIDADSIDDKLIREKIESIGYKVL
jgi:copper chaperone CopZ